MSLKKKVSVSRNSKKKKTFNLKRSLKESSQEKKKDLKDEIEEHFKNNLENGSTTDKLFCESLQECSNNVLNYIGFKSFPESLKEEINNSIFNFSHLLKYSFLESIKLAISIFGIVAFSVPSIENFYIKGKNISENVLTKISLVSSKIKKKFIDNISRLGNINPVEILTSIKNIILKHKVLVSISTVCLVLFSIQFCRVVNLKGGIKKFSEHFSFVEILKKNLNFFPLNTNIGQVIIEYTGMFIDNSRSIVNKIIEPINSVCQFNFSGSNYNVILQKHQNESLKYLSEKCMNQHGLILYHKMGTGKTLTALSILSERVKNRDLNIQDIIIICPSMTQLSWITESKKINLRLNNKCFKDYEGLQDLIAVHRFTHGKENKELFEGKFLVLDECHHLIPILKENNFKNYHHYIQLFNRSKNILLLTGTPDYHTFTSIYSDNSQSDISLLLNISEGHKNDFPITEDEWRKRYTDKKLLEKRSKSIFFNWFKPAARFGQRQALKKVENYYWGWVGTILYSSIGTGVNDLALINRILLKYLINPIRDLMAFTFRAQKNEKMKLEEIIEISNEIISKVELPTTKSVLSIENKIAISINQFFKNFVEGVFFKISPIIILTILFIIISHLINRLFAFSFTGDGDIKKSLKLLQMDYDKLGMEAGRYISFFTYRDNTDFAKINEGEHFETSYSFFQAEMCFKLYFDILDKKYKNFITGFSKEEEIVKGNVLASYIGNYQYSISIGNFSPYIDDIIEKKNRF